MYDSFHMIHNNHFIKPVNLLVNISCCIFSYRGGAEMMFPWKELCCPSPIKDERPKSIITKSDQCNQNGSADLSVKIVKNPNR